MSSHRLLNNTEMNLTNVELNNDLLETNDHQLTECIQNTTVNHTRENFCNFTNGNEHLMTEDYDSVSKPVNELYYTDFIKKLPYTKEEDETILNFVLKGQNIFKTSSLSLWKQLESKKGNPKRTYQSLKNRFLRNIKPNLFTTYRHMVKDKKTVKKIVEKFPELKQLAQNDRKYKYGYKLCEPKLRNQNRFSNDESNGFVNIYACKDGMETKNSEESTSLFNDSQSSSNAFKKIEFKNNTIFITVKCEIIGREEAHIRKEGIYEKYLKLKKENVIHPCPVCGRGEIETMEDEGAECEVIFEELNPNCSKNVNGKKKKHISEPIISSSSSVVL